MTATFGKSKHQFSFYPYFFRTTNWDITSRLDSIWMPSLLTSGRYDEFTPTQATVVYKGIPDCRWVLFEHGSHMPHAEETEHYLEILNDFLTRIEVQD